MSEPLRLGFGTLLFSSPEAAVAEVSGLRFLSATSEAAAKTLLPYVDGDVTVALHGEALIKLAEGLHLYDEIHPYCNVAYLKSEPVEELIPEGVTIRLLEESDARFVTDNYEAFAVYDYVLDRIRAGLFGAIIDGNIAGFMGIHDEGSMGLLKILPEYRRRHLAEALERKLINLQLRKGAIPFGQVAADNIASLNLQKKLGLTVSDETVTWMYHL